MLKISTAILCTLLALMSPEEPAKSFADSGRTETSDATRMLTAAERSIEHRIAEDERENQEPFDLTPVLEELREENELLGLAAIVIDQNRTVAQGVTGIKKLGEDAPFELGDQVHIGSCTKAMTAVIIADLIEQEELSWDTTIADVFPDLLDEIHPNYRQVTIRQLLDHQGGFPANGPWWGLRGENDTEKRIDLLTRIGSAEPPSEPGESFTYSNVSFAIAGLIAEKTTEQSWQELMQERIFAPLEMESAGFGPPGTTGELDQPWGHSAPYGTVVASQADNASPLGPAGTVHCTLQDWAKFVAIFTDNGRRENPILTQESIDELTTLTPVANAALPYAGGWIVLPSSGAQAGPLTHGGSNTMWFVNAWIEPSDNNIVLIATNCGGPGAETACTTGIAKIKIAMSQR